MQYIIDLAENGCSLREIARGMAIKAVDFTEAEKAAYHGTYATYVKTLRQMLFTQAAEGDKHAIDVLVKEHLK